MKINRNTKLTMAGAALLTLGIGSAAIALAATPAPEPSQTSPAATATQLPSVPPRATVQPSPSAEPIAEEPVVEEAPIVGVPNGQGEKTAPPTVLKPPAVVPPVVPPIVESPAPHVVDHTPRFRHNANYTPGCNGANMAFVYSQETSEGGGIVISVAYKYDVTTYDTDNGFGAKIYVCDL